MEEILYDKKTVAVRNERYYEMVLQYSLIEEMLAVEYCELKSYGVQIKKTAYFQDGHTERECKRISGLFFSRQEAERFLSILAKNQVTPIGLRPVVEDYAGKTGKHRSLIEV